MPRGKTTKPKPAASQTSSEEPRRRPTKPKPAASQASEEPKKKVVTRTRKKAMASKENKVTVGSKRKQKASDGQQEGSKGPARKRQKPASSAATEDTDRAVFVHRDPPRPQPVVEEKKADDTISHHSHRREPGEVMTFGQGDIGQLGQGESVDERKKPFPVGGELEGKKVVQVVCGGMHTAALTDQGEVYTWGCNDECALGRPTEEGEEFLPGHVRALEGVTVVQLSAGDCHTAALSNTGVVYCWGVFRDSNGPFGLVKPGAPSPSPVVVYESPSNRAIKVVSGSDHVVVLTSDGDVYSFGCAEQGQLGRVPECFSTRGGRKGLPYLLEPQEVRFRKSHGHKLKFSDVFCGSYTTFAYTKSRHLYAWGLNNYGQLGVDDTSLRFVPEQLSDDWMDAGEEVDSSIEGGEGLEVAGGQHHSIICHRGCVFVMGRKEYGRLGLGENNTEPAAPARVPSLTSIASVAAGSVCSFAVSRSGQVYSWGMGTSLQLGNGCEDDIWEPTPIISKKIENRKVIASAAGGQHTALLVSVSDDS